MANQQDKFEIICNYDNPHDTNVNEVFESYGVSTLEARIPIVDNKLADRVKNSNKDQQKYDTLVLKSEAASNAVEGRIARTKNRQLTLVDIGKDTVIAAGQVREKSPVDPAALDNELEEYMRKTAEIRAQRNQARQNLRERAMQLPDVPMLPSNMDTDWD